MKDFISFRISYTDNFGANRQSWRKYSIMTISDGKWHQLCMNVHDRVLLDTNVKADLRYKIYIEVVKVSRELEADISIDDVFIWSEPVLGKFGWFINYFSDVFILRNGKKDYEVCFLHFLL